MSQLPSSGDLGAQGFVRLSDLGAASRGRDERYCACCRPDVWVRAESQGNHYRCGKCGGYVRGMER